MRSADGEEDVVVHLDRKCERWNVDKVLVFRVSGSVAAVAFQLVAGWMDG